MAIMRLSDLPRVSPDFKDDILLGVNQGESVAISIDDIVNEAVRRSLETRARASASVVTQEVVPTAGAIIGAAGMAAAKNPTISRRFWARRPK